MELDLNLNIEQITIYVESFKLFVMTLCTYYTYLKITNNYTKTNILKISNFIYLPIISVAVMIIRYASDYYISIVALIFLLSLLCLKNTKDKLGYTMLTTTISLSINYVFLFIGVVITFLINLLYVIKSDYINMGLIIINQVVLLLLMTKMKRLKNGLSFLRKNSQNDYIDLIILNISLTVIFSFVIIVDMDIKTMVSKSLGFGFIIFAIIMFVTIQKSIQLYYKQKLIIKNLTETKSELENAKQEIQTLEKENIELSKKNHSFKHQYKSLKHKVDEINKGNNTNEEADLNKELDNLSKDIYIAPKNTELSKTGFVEIDDMLNCMKSECDENNINFNLQIIGNIHYMINNLIPKEELEILLADHIKDAIIAINHSDNVNKSILVKLGKTEDFYGLYIYDSGIEFEKETLENLGKKPITTHSDEGGSGMGFMNTFDTLKKNNASLIINQIGKPSKDNFTKVLEFRFDGKSEFKVLGAEK